MGGGPISTSGTTNPDFSSSAQGKNQTTTGVNIGGSTGPTLYLGSVGPSNTTLIVGGVVLVAVLFFLFRRG